MLKFFGAGAHDRCAGFFSQPAAFVAVFAHLRREGGFLVEVGAHGGGFVPYQIGRFEHGHAVRADTSADTLSKPFDMFKNFYFDALTHDPRATRHLLQMVGSGRVVLGTDSPFDMGEERPVEHLDAVPGLTAREREDVSYRTACALFGEQP